MKPLLIVAAVFISITSCKERECVDVEGDLTQEEETWLSYSGGEVLVFQRDTTYIDTFWVSHRGSYRNIGYAESEDRCQHHQEVAFYNITDSTNHVSDSTSTNFKIQSTHTNQWVGAPAGKAGVIYDAAEDLLAFDNFSPQDNIVIHGHTYNGVYIMTLDTTSWQSPAVWRFYYTKQNGILRFDITQGRQWERIN